MLVFSDKATDASGVGGTDDNSLTHQTVGRYHKANIESTMICANQTFSNILIRYFIRHLIKRLTLCMMILYNKYPIVCMLTSTSCYWCAK